jgi:hypothetical protein
MMRVSSPVDTERPLTMSSGEIMRCTRNEECSEGEEQRGRWQMKVGLVIPETESRVHGVVVEQTHLRTKQGWPALFHF